MAKRVEGGGLTPQGQVQGAPPAQTELHDLESGSVQLPSLVRSTVSWKDKPPAEVRDTLARRAREIFKDVTLPLLEPADSVINGIDRHLASAGRQWDFQWGQIAENWMIFINFAVWMGYNGREALINLNAASFTERTPTYTQQHKQESDAARASINAVVADGLEVASRAFGHSIHVHDAGCANADRTREIMGLLRAAGVDCEFSGSDISDKMVEAAKGKDLAEVVQANLVEGIPLSRKADAVICLDDTIGHIPGEESRIRALKNFAAVSGDGAFVILDTNNRGGYFTARTQKNDTVRGMFLSALPEKYKPILEGTTVGVNLYTVGGPGAVCYLHHFRKDELAMMLDAAGYDVVPLAAKRAGQSEPKGINTVSLSYSSKDRNISAGTVNDGFNEASLVILARKRQ